MERRAVARSCLSGAAVAAEMKTFISLMWSAHQLSHGSAIARFSKMTLSLWSSIARFSIVLRVLFA